MSQGNAATATYDELGRLTRVDNTNLSSSIYLYDANGNQTDSIFQPAIDLTVTVDPPGAGTVTGAGRFRHDTNASLSATPAGSFLFSGWFESGTLVSSSPTYAFTVTAARNLVAKFYSPGPEIEIADTTHNPAVNLVDETSTLTFVHPSTLTRTLTIRNEGTAPLTGLSVTLAGTGSSFFNKTSLPGTLAPGATTILTVQFTATSPITSTATLHILSNDANEASFDLVLNGTMTCPAITVTPPASSQGVIGMTINRPFVQSGGLGAATFALVSGSLPLGVSLTSNGVLTGIPSQTGSFPLSVGVTDSYGCTGTSSTYTLLINSGGSDGSLDTGFGSDGRTTTHFGSGDDIAFGIVLQPDGKAVAAGYAFSEGKNRFALARYHADGTLDATFGGTGRVLTSVSSGEDEAHCLAVQNDGKIVAAGYSRPDYAKVAVVRYNTDGTVDTTFGTDGKVLAAVADEDNDARAIAIQTDGKIVVAGYGYKSGWNDFIVLRLHSDGSLDNSFASGGKLKLAFGGSYDTGYGLALQPDGKMIVVGSTYDDVDHFAVARINSDGSLDSSFGSDGKVVTRFGSVGSTATSVVIQPNGKIIVGGNTSDGIEDFAMARFNADGSLDSTFGSGGKVTTDWHNRMDIGKAVTLQRDGKVLLAGFARDASNKFNMALARFNQNGSLDTTYGVAGKTLIPVGVIDDRANALAILPFGSAILAGQSSNGSNDDFAVVRINGQTNVPDMAVEMPSGASAFYGSTANFGPVTNGSSSSLSFIIRNKGVSDLTGLSVTLDGADVSMFEITQIPSSALASGIGSTAVTIKFSPTAAGTRTATLHVSSDDPDEPAFEVKLSGTGMFLMPTFDEDLTFDDNQVPTGWTLGYPIGGPGTDASIANQRFEARPVDTYAGLDRAKQVPVTAGKVVVSYTGALNNSPWGHATQVRFLTDDGGEYFTSFGKTAIYSTMNAIVGKEGQQPWAFEQVFAMVEGSYRMVAEFEDARITYSVTKIGSNTPLISQIVSVPTLQIHRLQTLRLLSLIGTGPASWIDDVSIRAIPKPPEIVVEQPLASDVPDGGSRDFGSIAPDSASSLSFTIKNVGIAELTGFGLTIDGSDASMFSVTSNPVSPISGPLGLSSFTVRFAPTSAGAKSAVLHIVNNDGDESPFDITLTGTGLSPSQSWRKRHFNTTSNTGQAADEATPMHDGVPNLMKFATGMDPSKTGRQPGTIQHSSASIVFTYNRSKAALSDGVQFTVEWSDTLAPGSWSADGASFVVTDEGATEKIDVAIPSGTSQRRFVRLRVSR